MNLVIESDTLSNDFEPFSLSETFNNLFFFLLLGYALSVACSILEILYFILNKKLKSIKIDKIDLKLSSPFYSHQRRAHFPRRYIENIIK